MAIIIAQHILHILNYHHADSFFLTRLDSPEKSVTSDTSGTTVINVVKKSHLFFTNFLHPLVSYLLSESLSNGTLSLQFYTINI